MSLIGLHSNSSTLPEIKTIEDPDVNHVVLVVEQLNNNSLLDKTSLGALAGTDSSVSFARVENAVEIDDDMLLEDVGSAKKIIEVPMKDANVASTKGAYGIDVSTKDVNGSDPLMERGHCVNIEDFDTRLSHPSNEGTDTQTNSENNYSVTKPTAIYLIRVKDDTSAEMTQSRERQNPNENQIANSQSVINIHTQLEKIPNDMEQALAASRNIVLEGPKYGDDDAIVVDYDISQCQRKKTTKYAFECENILGDSNELEAASCQALIDR